MKRKVNQISSFKRLNGSLLRLSDVHYIMNPNGGSQYQVESYYTIVVNSYDDIRLNRLWTDTSYVTDEKMAAKIRDGVRTSFIFSQAKSWRAAQNKRRCFNALKIPDSIFALNYVNELLNAAGHHNHIISGLNYCSGWELLKQGSGK